MWKFRLQNIDHAVQVSNVLTPWSRVTDICVGNLTIIGLDNCLSPGRRQAIIWTNAGILLIGPLGTKCSNILIEIQTFSFKKMHLRMSSAKWRPFCGKHFQKHFVEWKVWLIVHQRLFLGIQLTTRHHLGNLGNGLAPIRQHTIIWINDGLLWWCIYASLSISELNIRKAVLSSLREFLYCLEDIMAFYIATNTSVFLQISARLIHWVHILQGRCMIKTAKANEYQYLWHYHRADMNRGIVRSLKIARQIWSLHRNFITVFSLIIFI